MATTAYTIIAPTPAGLPSNIVVRVVAMRDDGKKLSREELEALAAAYPPPAAQRAAVRQAIEDAPERPAARAKRAPSKASTSTTSAKRAPASTSKPKPAAKRAAAKRPASK